MMLMICNHLFVYQRQAAGGELGEFCCSSKPIDRAERHAVPRRSLNHARLYADAICPTNCSTTSTTTSGFEEPATATSRSA